MGDLKLVDTSFFLYYPLLIVYNRYPLMRNGSFTLVLLLVGFLFTPENAYAYLDPGTGSYLLQIVAGGLLAAIFTLKNYRKKIGVFFKKLLKRE